VLRIESLSAAYDGEAVLRDVGLDVPAGQLLCVLGPSGGGKSTLLRVIAGLEDPTAGTVTLDGRDLADVPAHARAFGLRMRGEGGAAAGARVAELLQLVGLPGAERRRVSQLSGGEQQRVALARALAPRPGLLMLDEPMGSLDRSLRERLPEELRAIFAELGLTVIYVTHDQDEALTVADRVVLLDHGRIVADGTPQELWTHPPTAWAARFLGFRNVAPAAIGPGVVETPWGRLPLETDARARTGALACANASAGAGAGAGAGPPTPGAVTVVLRPAALVAVTDGPIHGRVLARRFRGDHVLLLVDVESAPTLHVEAREGDLPVTGDAITLAVLPGGIHVIDEPSALPSGHD
jgi:thiamine transport system ATP-binding protein